MRLTRLGDILAFLAFLPVLALMTRAGSQWLALAVAHAPGSLIILFLLAGVMLVLCAILGWAIYRVTGGVSLVAGLSLSAAGLAALSLGYPAWDRGQHMRALAPVFASDFGPTEVIAAPRRVRLADYRNGEVYARGVTCPADCLDLLSGGLLDEVILVPPFGQPPEGLSARLDSDTPGCMAAGGCMVTAPTVDAAPRLTVVRSIMRPDGTPLAAAGLSGVMRVEVYLDDRRILRRSSALTRGVQPFTLPLLTGARLSYPRHSVWLSPQGLAAHAPLSEIFAAVTR